MPVVLRRGLALAAITAALGGLLVASLPVGVATRPTTPLDPLVEKVTGAAVTTHLQAFQRFADASGGSRTAGTAGYDASLGYVAEKLRTAGYDVSTPEVTFGRFSVQAARLTAAGAEVPVAALIYSPSTPPGGVTAPLAVIAQDATSGCEATDFAGVQPGAIVLIRRGTCPFAAKAKLASRPAGSPNKTVTGSPPCPALPRHCCSPPRRTPPAPATSSPRPAPETPTTS